jgi:hypothetical protein
VEISQYIMFADTMPAPRDPDSTSRVVSRAVSRSATPTLMPSFSLDDLQSDTEFPRLSDEEEDMLVQVRHRLFFFGLPLNYPRTRPGASLIG